MFNIHKSRPNSIKNLRVLVTESNNHHINKILFLSLFFYLGGGAFFGTHYLEANPRYNGISSVDISREFPGSPVVRTPRSHC